MIGSSNDGWLKKGAALAVLILLCLPATQALGDVFWWMDDEEKETTEKEILDGPDIREPFFAMMFNLAEGDSLGTWSSDIIHSRLESYGRESRFPVEQLYSMTRRVAEGLEQESRLGQQVSRIWEIELVEDLDRPMPYSILGYHPGSLRVSRRVVFSEWNLGPISLSTVTEDGDVELVPLENVMIMRLDEGYIILDVDGWLDALLGKGLDDAWTLGMALARTEDYPIGLAISIGRKDRHIFGELDLKADEVKTHGSPIARALSYHGRKFTVPNASKVNIPWSRGD